MSELEKAGKREEGLHTVCASADSGCATDSLRCMDLYVQTLSVLEKLKREEGGGVLQ
jgi:hypothetical protein